MDTIGLVTVVQRDGAVVLISPQRAKALAEALLTAAIEAEREEVEHPVLVVRSDE